MPKPESYLETLEIPEVLVRAEAAYETYLGEARAAEVAFMDTYRDMQLDKDLDFLINNAENPELEMTRTALCAVGEGEDERQVARNVIACNSHRLKGFMVLDRDPQTGEISDVAFLPVIKPGSAFISKESNDELEPLKALFVRPTSTSGLRANLNTDTFDKVLNIVDGLGNKVVDFVKAPKVGMPIDTRSKESVRELEDAVCAGRVPKVDPGNGAIKKERAFQQAIDGAAEAAFRWAFNCIKLELNTWPSHERVVTIATPIPNTVPPQSVQADVKITDLRRFSDQSIRGGHEYVGKRSITLGLNPRTVYTHDGQPSHIPYPEAALKDIDSLSYFIGAVVFTNAERNEISSNNDTFEDRPRARDNRVVVRDGPHHQIEGIVDADVDRVGPNDLSMLTLGMLFKDLREGRKHQRQIEARQAAGSAE